MVLEALAYVLLNRCLEADMSEEVGAEVDID